MEQKIVTYSRAETIALGQRFAEHLTKGCLVTLKGDLGAGKTTFVKGIAIGLEISLTVNSPTFNIQKNYQGRLLLVHIDAYRLEGITQNLGFSDYFDDESVVVIEWADFIENQLPKADVAIEIVTIDDNTREFRIEGIEL